MIRDATYAYGNSHRPTQNNNALFVLLEGNFIQVGDTETARTLWCHRPKRQMPMGPPMVSPCALHRPFPYHRGQWANMRIKLRGNAQGAKDEAKVKLSGNVQGAKDEAKKLP